jgi:hypothetical protein
VQEDLPGAPQHRQQRLDLFADRALLVWRPHLVLTFHQKVEAPVMLENDRSLGFRRMRGEHQLDLDASHGRRDLILLEPSSGHLMQALSPQRLHR